MDARERRLAYCYHYQGDAKRISFAFERGLPVQAVKTTESYLCIGDEAYPQALYDLAIPPQVLFYRGHLELLKRPSVSIIGSREAIPYSIEMTQRLIERLDPKTVVVSGLAKGIDGIAHQAALKAGSTIAILGCGIDQVYPRSHRDLFQTIRQKGLILSEYPPGTPPDRFRFPQRNRLIAALGERLVVMQASLKSGTMITVNEALELGKDITVLPYRLGEIEGEGCNALIQQGANLLTNLDDMAKL